MRYFVWFIICAVSGALIGMTDAEARRLGGSRSIGIKRYVAPSQPSKPIAGQAAHATPGQKATGTPATTGATGMSRWLPMLGGLALGGLLGSMFGGAGVGGIVLLVLLAVAAVMLFRAFNRPTAATGGAIQYAGPGSNQVPHPAIGGEMVATYPPSQAAGLDAGPFGGASTSLPQGFDVQGFLRSAKLNFIKLQIANDLGNVAELREFTTAEMFAELSHEIARRDGARQQTDVLSLNATLLEIVAEGDRYWASVRFSGMMRETPGSSPEGFQEIWNLAKPADGSSGWLLAGIQQMH